MCMKRREDEIRRGKRVSPSTPCTCYLPSTLLKLSIRYPLPPRFGDNPLILVSIQPHHLKVPSRTVSVPSRRIVSTRLLPKFAGNLLSPGSRDWPRYPNSPPRTNPTPIRQMVKFGTRLWVPVLPISPLTRPQPNKLSRVSPQVRPLYFWPT